MSDLPRNFWESLSNISEATIKRLHRSSLEVTDSPIEALFATAVAYMLRLQGQQYRLARSARIAGSEPYMPEGITWFVETQAPIATTSYRVDFLIQFEAEDGKRRIIVECDGHDFHERTKEQAARDRARDRHLQDEGFKVFRFTGSELYRDPFNCAAEAMLSIMRLDDRGERQ